MLKGMLFSCYNLGGKEVADIRFKVEGEEIEAREGQSILEAALAAGIYIPHLCSHPDLTSIGECKMCVVEISGREGTQLSCMTKAEDGMEVTVNSEHLKTLRRTALEFMLAGHPHDCTSCKMYLKCELQAMMQYTDAVHGRMRHITKQTTYININNPLIVREMERCIQCGRCIRACDEIRGVGILKLNKHSENGETYVGTEGDVALAEANCRFCGACIEVCPTGALQDAEGIFKQDIPRKQALVPCQAECPAHTDIAEYIRLTREGDCVGASAVIHEKLPFPKALGRICTHTCEGACKRNGLNDPLSIRNIKRYAVEHDTEKLWKTKAIQLPDTGKRVAVVGGGPAGLTAALYLRKKGHDVTIFEQYKKLGGYMQYGIPSYRLPREEVDEEIADVLYTGINVVTERRIESITELKDEGYEAIVLAMGTSIGRITPIKGPKGTRITAAEFLHRVSEGEEPEEIKNKNVVVLGGGNVAFDAARTAIRLGARVEMICMEARKDMLADDEEIEQGIEEGINLHDSCAHLEIAGEDEMEGVLYAKISGFQFVEDGLHVDVIEGTQTVAPADTVLFAMGQRTDIPMDFGVELSRFYFPICKEGTAQTSAEGVFAAGDVMTGTRSVVMAIAGGRRAASECDIYLGGDGNIDETLYERPKSDPKLGVIDGFYKKPRQKTKISPLESRLRGFDQVEEAFDDAAVGCETERCLQCDLRCDLGKVKIWTDFKRR